jgi:maltose alpha-D-glucosyltransferase/alpha-amylase
MGSKRRRFEGLGRWLLGQRWFAAKQQRIEGVAVEDEVVLDGGVLTLVSVTLAGGAVQHYAIALREGPDFSDALDDPGFCRGLVRLITGGGHVPGRAGELVGAVTSAFPPDLPPAIDARRLEGEQSNTSVAFGDRLVFKQFRRPAPGVNPELEITRFLTEHTGFRHTPRLAGWLEYRPRTGTPVTMGVLEEFVPGSRDGWRWMLDQLGSCLSQLVTASSAIDVPRLRLAAGSSLDAVRRLGVRTAELHGALASETRDPAFVPEPIEATDLSRWAEDIAGQILEARRALGGQALPNVASPAAALAGLLGRAKIRHHGDYHLGQTLYVEGRRDFMIIDFEGEPLRSLEVRRRKHAALRDVAGMLRSLDYAAVTAAGGARPGLVSTPRQTWAEAWETEARHGFVAGYRQAAAGATFVPETEQDFLRAVAAFEVEKAAYEIVYEANQRPDWIAIPVRGFGRAAANLGAAVDRPAP